MSFRLACSFAMNQDPLSKYKTVLGYFKFLCYNAVKISCGESVRPDICIVRRKDP